jgi:Na+/phosphate symporter
MTFLNLDCLKPSTTTGDAHITVKLNCCNKKIKKKTQLSEKDIAMLSSLFEQNDDKFNEILKIIVEELKKDDQK